MSEQSGDKGTKSVNKFNLAHLGIAGGVVSAMVMLQPVKDFFYTREEGNSVEMRVEKVEHAILALSTQMREQQEKSTDRMVNALAEQDRRLEARFSSLETSLNRTVELLLRRDTINNKQQGGQ